MKTKKYYLILFISCFVYSSCLTTHCDGFPDKLKGWMPYKIGDVLKFQSDSDQIVFKIDSTYITRPYSFEGQIERVCSANYEFSSDKNKYPLVSGVCILANCNSISVNYNFTFEKLKLNNMNFGFDIKTKIVDNLKSYLLDTISYSLKKSIIQNVISIEKLPPYNNPDVNKIFVHNGKGLVGFIKNGREYKLVE